MGSVFLPSSSAGCYGLSNIDERKMGDTIIEFPEVESFTLGTPPVEEAPLQVEEPSRAKANFNRVALKVLAKLSDFREIESRRQQHITPVVSDEAENPASHSPIDVNKNDDLTKGSSTSRSRQGSISKAMEHSNQPSQHGSRVGSASSNRRFSVSSLQGIRGQTGSSFASLVKLASLRRPVNAHKRTHGKKSMADISEEEVIELPSHPRFSSTLSPEAQYAMLKGYEDVLLTDIRTAYPGCNSHLLRVKTPKNIVVATHISGADENAKSKHSPRESSAQDADEQRNVGSHKSIFGDDIGRIKMDQKSWKSSKSRSRPSTSSRRCGTPMPAISREKQLWLSYRFETAMDILDHMKTSRGEVVTSPRLNLKKVQPLNNYNSWSKSWAKDFQFQVSNRN